MAKAKVLTDRVSITSDVFTDENLERIKLIAPSILEPYCVIYCLDTNDPMLWPSNTI